MSNKKSFRFISDPGHGWLEVPRVQLEALSLAEKVSPFSYQHDGKVYLEEDCDMALFTEALKSRGVEFQIQEVYEKDTPIRGYAQFRDEREQHVRVFQEVIGHRWHIT